MIQNFSDHAANERTFLAWVRTAIAVMAFGFLVARFNLFVRVAAQSLVGGVPPSALRGGGLGNLAGLVLIVSGTVIVVVAAIRFVRIGRAIDSPTQQLGGVRTDLALAALIVILGIAMVAYLSETLRGRSLKNLLIVMLVLVALALGIVIARNRPSADQEAVEYRQALMTVIGGQMQPLSAMQRGRGSYDGELMGLHAGNLVALGRMIPEAFARNTHAARSVPSAALPQVWTNHALFLASATRLVADAAVLQSAVASGDRQQVIRASGTLSGECAQCHRGFRAN